MHNYYWVVKETSVREIDKSEIWLSISLLVFIILPYSASLSLPYFPASNWVLGINTTRQECQYSFSTGKALWSQYENHCTARRRIFEFSDNLFCYCSYFIANNECVGVEFRGIFVLFNMDNIRYIIVDSSTDSMYSVQLILNLLFISERF